MLALPCDDQERLPLRRGQRHPGTGSSASCRSIPNSKLPLQTHIFEFLAVKTYTDNRIIYC